jgi:hypothetical protein
VFSQRASSIANGSEGSVLPSEFWQIPCSYHTCGVLSHACCPATPGTTAPWLVTQRSNEWGRQTKPVFSQAACVVAGVAAEQSRKQDLRVQNPEIQLSPVYTQYCGTGTGTTSPSGEAQYAACHVYEALSHID